MNVQLRTGKLAGDVGQGGFQEWPPAYNISKKASQVTLGKCIWAGSQKAAKFTEQVNMQIAWEVGRAGDGVIGDSVFILALGGNQCL